MWVLNEIYLYVIHTYTQMSLYRWIPYNGDVLAANTVGLIIMYHLVNLHSDTQKGFILHPKCSTWIVQHLTCIYTAVTQKNIVVLSHTDSILLRFVWRLLAKIMINWEIQRELSISWSSINQSYNSEFTYTHACPVNSPIFYYSSQKNKCLEICRKIRIYNHVNVIKFSNATVILTVTQFHLHMLHEYNTWKAINNFSKVFRLCASSFLSKKCSGNKRWSKNNKLYSLVSLFPILSFYLFWLRLDWCVGGHRIFDVLQYTW